jgi:endonuclease YncB( thermonuclease family)
MRHNFSGIFKYSVWIVSLLCCSWLIAAEPECQASASKKDVLSAAEKVAVVQVFDGDTVLLADGRRVRFIGINTPEVARDQRPAEPLADEAKVWLERVFANSAEAFLKNGAVSVDRYGRVLGHLFDAEGRNITEALLRNGWGFQVVIPPNVWHADCYRLAEVQAREAKKGVWGHDWHRIIQADDVSRLKGGFGRFEGKIERISVQDEVIWIDLVGEISLKIRRSQARWLSEDTLKKLFEWESNGRYRTSVIRLQARGWLMDRNLWGDKMRHQIASGKRNRWQLDVPHELMLEWNRMTF